MRRYLVILLCSVLSIPAVARASSQQSAPVPHLSVNDVIKLVQAKVPDDLIIAQLRQVRSPLPLSADDLVRLKTAGVSDSVLRVMVNSEMVAAPAVPSARLPLTPRVEEGEAKALLDTRVTAESDGRAKVLSFRKTDGQTAQVNGVDVYRLAFTAAVEFTQDCKWLREPFGISGVEFKTRDMTRAAARGASPMSDFFEASQNPGVLMKKGQLVNITGELRFERSERGWSIASITGSLRSEPAPAVSSAPSSSQTTETPSPRSGVMSSVAFSNRQFRSIRIFLDGAEQPIEINSRGSYTADLEVGSTHTVKAVVGGSVSTKQFVVTAVMKPILIGSAGINLQ